MARLRASVVNAIAFAELAGALGLGEHIRLGRGEEGSGGRHKASVLADAFEALVGAAFLDRGIDAVREVLEPIFTFQLDEIIDAGGGQDAKGLLQEVAAREHAALPSYNVAASGPDHDKRFVAHVYVADELYGAGTGRSKKSAEQGAAREALDRIQGALGDRPMRIMSAQAPEDVAGGRR